jgi:uncharacterized protein (DUF983 family)
MGCPRWPRLTLTPSEGRGAPERLPDPIVTGLRCRCPRCGEGAVFRGYLKLRPRCEKCGLDLGFAEGSEGPAVFVIFIVGFLVVGAAALSETVWDIHPLMHLALWIPATIVLSLALLRPFKGVMIALHYRHLVHESPP